MLEKWDFKVDYEDQKANGINSNVKADMPEETKDMKTIQKEIREVIRQITGNDLIAGKDFKQSIRSFCWMYFLIWNILTGTVSFLPLLDCLCSFDILAYTVPDCNIPNQWDETQPVFIANSQEVQLRSFSTSIHKMDTIVSYKNTWAYLFIFLYATIVNTNSILCHVSIITYQRLLLLIAVMIWLLVIDSNSRIT